MVSSLTKKIKAFDSWCLRHPPYSLDRLCLQRWALVLYGTTTPVRYYPLIVAVFCCHLCLPMPVKASRALHAFIWDPPNTGNAEPEDLDKPGWEWLMTICTHSISAWQWQGGVLGIDLHGDYSRRQLCLLYMFPRESERDGQGILLCILKKKKILHRPRSVAWEPIPVGALSQQW